MRALFEGGIRAVVTLDVLAEYSVVLRSRVIAEAAGRAGLSLGSVLAYAEAVADCVAIIDPGVSFRCADPDDDKFTAASTGGHAKFIVSSDRALLDLKEVLEARVVTPEEFVEVLKQ